MVKSGRNSLLLKGIKMFSPNTLSQVKSLTYTFWVWLYKNRRKKSS